MDNDQRSLLQTWIDFNLNVDKQTHAPVKFGIKLLFHYQTPTVARLLAHHQTR